ncbi:MAG: 30S ribosomal protein S12 methylthiotransferase RimO [Spirochaetaceae bacterium]|jgi:ribosomal protein S12 methylthiotransferase|nr:30S ribosomal protein S12 methylthiotransferase RimO [Spirochaetaceae bacterium]
MRYYLESLGCAKNQVDAEIMMGTMNHSGWVSVTAPEDADLIIVNSCAFIDRAKLESINTVLELREEYPGKKILLAGCLSQRYGADLANSLPEADAYFGNRDLGRIAEVAAGIMGVRRSPARPATDKAAPSMGERPLLSIPGAAYVKIAEGCDNRCSFCAIPLIRGPMRSRPVEDITAECRRLLERGVRELCLIGQDLGVYGSGGPAGLPELLRALARLEGHFWVRLLYIHPEHFPRPIMDLMREDPRFLPYFDLPFQHASGPLLRAMNRRGEAADFLALIAEIRETLPDAVIRSTFITGFPGETRADFQKLLDFQDQARLDWVGVFDYSQEEGTAAFSMEGQVPGRIARERKTRIENRQIPITGERMDRFIGRELEALVEEAVPAPVEHDKMGKEDLYLGRFFCHAPEVDGAVVIRRAGPGLLKPASRKMPDPGDMVRCKVFARAGFDLEAVIVPPEGAAS